MQLTMYTDYSLRVLLFLAVQPEGTVGGIADAYAISRNHLVKVVHHLALAGFIESQRGRNGGIRLARDAREINVGDVVRRCEPNFHLVECFDPERGKCVVNPACQLKGVLARAHQAFMAELDRHTLADIATNPGELAPLLGIGAED